MEEFKEAFGEEEKIKGCYRFCPCPSYDIRGTEEWLEDMASKGYHLEKKGIVLGTLFCFVKGEKKEVRYRLQATKWRDEPEDEVQEVSREYGWEYVDIRGDFYIWRSEDASARELITDSTVHAAAVEILRRQQRSNVIWAVISAIIFLIAVRGTFLIIPIWVKSWKILFIGSVVVGAFIVDVRKVKAIGKIKKRLLLGETPEPTYNWRDKKTGYFIRKIIAFIIDAFAVVLLILIEFSIAGTDVESGKEQVDGLPFVTMKELCKEEGVRQDNEVWSVGRKEWSDWLSPTNYLWKEKFETGGWSEDGGRNEGYWNDMTVCYHETWFPWMAKCIAKEYHRLERTRDFLYMDRYEDITPELTLPGVDYLKVYAFYSMEPRAVIVKGNKVLYIRFQQWGDGRIPLEEWLTAVAASF